MINLEEKPTLIIPNLPSFQEGATVIVSNEKLNQILNFINKVNDNVNSLITVTKELNDNILKLSERMDSNEKLIDTEINKIKNNIRLLNDTLKKVILWIN